MCSIEVWIPWLAEGILHDVQLFWTNGETDSLGSLPVQCHTPLTVSLLDETRTLNKVLVRISTCHIVFSSIHFTDTIAK